MADEMTDAMLDRYDVVVVGGGAAGLSAGLMLGRSRRSVAVLDAGRPRNAPAAGVHGLLGHDGIPPAQLLAKGREEVRRYGGHVVPAQAEAVTRDGAGFLVGLADGRTVRGRRLLVATGLVDTLPEVPGLRERWGRDVLHCPYCHGWEVRDQAIGILATGPMAMHQVLLLRQWTDDLTLFTHESFEPTEEQLEQMAARGVTVVDGRVAAIEVADDQLVGLRMADGVLVPRDAVAVLPTMVAPTGFLAGLGIGPVEHPSGFGQYLPADPTGRSEVPGVWLAGNLTDLSAQVGTAAAGAAFTAAQVNMDLVLEETREAVEAHRRGAVA